MFVMKKLWIAGYFMIVIAALAFVAYKTLQIDPFFHYHAPNTADYFYLLNNERSQNNGIARHFDYEGIITGTSMTENFKASEAEDLWGRTFIKVPYSGGSYNEINMSLEAAVKYNPKLKVIIRGLDLEKFFDDKNQWRTDMGAYPTYLYDDYWYNDVEYVFNRSVLFSRLYPMMKENDNPDFQSGITSFDEYANWMNNVNHYTFGHKTLFPDGFTTGKAKKPVKLTKKEKDVIRGNIRQNVIALAEQHPDIDYYYFFTPYGAAWWYFLLADGKLDRQIEAERIVIEEILKCDNIKLFSFNGLFDITTDLNNYKDYIHYGEWINSLMLHYMHDGKYQLTSDNYLDYLKEEKQFYKKADYNQMTRQEDYEDDYYAAALLNKEINKTEPFHILENADSMELSDASVEEDHYNGQIGLVCTGTLGRSARSPIPLSEYFRDLGYIGAKIQIPDITPYKYLVFYGKKLSKRGELALGLYDKNGEEEVIFNKDYHNLDKKWHQYVIDVSDCKGPCTLILNGGCIDKTGTKASKSVFSEITLY